MHRTTSRYGSDVEAGISERQWAADIGTSQPHVHFMVTIWRDYQVITERPRFADAYAEAKGMPLDRGERREMEAMARVRNLTPERKAEMAECSDMFSPRGGRCRPCP